MQDRSLTCLGVGDGLPCADRNHSAYLYRLGPVTVLVDCGEGLSRSYKALGLSYELIDRIFLSHLHADHVGGFFMMLQSLWLEDRRKALTVHAPSEGLGPVRQMLRAGYLFDELLPFRLTFEPLAAGLPVRIGPVTVTPHLTTHLEDFRRQFGSMYPVGFEAYSFVLEGVGARIGHSADLGGVTDLEPLVAAPLDLLVCELSHFAVEELFGFLQGRRVRRLALVHLARAYRDKVEQVRTLASKMLPETSVCFPLDGEVIEL
jgi:ribonuclease BN (tRNA processing enzyme)